jgi:hypothetical protein
VSCNLLTVSWFLFQTTSFRKNGSFVDPINSEAKVRLTAPNYLTSYYLTAIAVNDIYGMGLTDQATVFKVSKNLVIDLTVPFVCKRSEVVSLLIEVRSSLNQSVTLSLARNDKEFDALNPGADGWTGKFCMLAEGLFAKDVFRTDDNIGSVKRCTKSSRRLFQTAAN